MNDLHDAKHDNYQRGLGRRYEEGNPGARTKGLEGLVGPKRQGGEGGLCDRSVTLGDEVELNALVRMMLLEGELGVAPSYDVGQYSL